MKRVIKRMAALVLAVSVLCGTVAGSYQNVQAGDFSAGALQYASDFSFLEALFNASGLSLGLDMLLKTQKDIDKFKEENWDFGDLLDQPLTQKQIDEAQEKIEKLYYGATEAYKKTHGNGSKPTPTPMITEPPAPGITPPVTVAPINPDDVEMPEDWGTMKKNAQDKGILAMGATTAYCVKEAVKGWWDDIMQTDLESNVSDNPYKNEKYLGYLEYECEGIYNGSFQKHYRKAYVYDYTVNSDVSYFSATSWNDSTTNLKYHDFRAKKSNGDDCFVHTYCVQELTYPSGTVNSSFTHSGYTAYNYPMSYGSSEGAVLNENYVFSVPVVIDGKTIPASALPPGKSSMWPSTDLKDDYDNNRSPNLPELVTPTLRLPTLDEIKDLWKQGTDDEENRPTYVTNFITNHTVQPTPDPEPTQKPDVKPTPTIAVVPDPGGGTDPDPDPNPTPSVTPAVVPDPGGDSGGGTDPDNPETPTPEEEASPYKADLKDIFPFCIPFDLIHLLKVFEADAEAPVFEFPLDIELDNPWTGKKVVDYHHTFELDMSDYEPVIKILRIFQVVFFIIALMLITRQQMIKG